MMILDPYFASRSELPTQWIGKLLQHPPKPPQWRKVAKRLKHRNADIDLDGMFQSSVGKCWKVLESVGKPVKTR